MKTQDYERITRLVVDKVAAWWKPYNDGMIDALLEDLAAYSNSTLEAGMKELRRTCKNQPRISQIIDACKGQSSSVETGKLPNFREKKPAIPEHEIREIMQSPIGKLACGDGCARSMWLAITEHGKRDFTLADITNWKAHQVEGIRLLTAFPDKKGILYRNLESFYERMREFDTDLVRKYAA